MKTLRSGSPANQEWFVGVSPTIARVEIELQTKVFSSPQGLAAEQLFTVWSPCFKSFLPSQTVDPAFVPTRAEFTVNVEMVWPSQAPSPRPHDASRVLSPTCGQQSNKTYGNNDSEVVN